MWLANNLSFQHESACDACESCDDDIINCVCGFILILRRVHEIEIEGFWLVAYAFDVVERD
jgi:hypothetical protein